MRLKTTSYKKNKKGVDKLHSIWYNKDTEKDRGLKSRQPKKFKKNKKSLDK